MWCISIYRFKIPKKYLRGASTYSFYLSQYRYATLVLILTFSDCHFVIESRYQVVFVQFCFRNYYRIHFVSLQCLSVCVCVCNIYLLMYLLTIQSFVPTILFYGHFVLAASMSLSFPTVPVSFFRLFLQCNLSSSGVFFHFLNPTFLTKIQHGLPG